MFSDPELPSVVSLVAGGPVRGSWWGHPAGRAIYQVGQALDDRPDLLSVPFLRGKSTLVHRSWWPELLAVARSRASWQLEGLGPSGRALLDQVERSGVLDVASISPLPLPAGRSMSDLARDLERRLLVLGRSEHSASGRHVKRLFSWTEWARLRGTGPAGVDGPHAQVRIEDHVDRLYAGMPVRRLLPWPRGERPSTVIGQRREPPRHRPRRRDR